MKREKKEEKKVKDDPIKKCKNCEIIKEIEDCETGCLLLERGLKKGKSA